MVAYGYTMRWLKIMKRLYWLVGLIIFCGAIDAYAQDNIVVTGLLKNMVVLEVNGVQRTIRAGKTSPEGILLVSADTKRAIVEIDGKRHTLQLSRRIGGVKYSAPAKTVVRIPGGRGGHHYTPGRINGRSVNFLVDTGATSLSLNSIMAKSIGIKFSSGKKISLQTANGITSGYQVTLQSVAVGDLKLSNVEAVVVEGQYPAEILLGNSYLSRVNFKVESGVLILESKY